MSRLAYALLGLGLGMLLATAGPLVAVPEAPPEPDASYRVVGVAADDRLNVRRQPGVGGEIVATLAADERGLLVSGERMEVDGGVWWTVLLPDRTEGWVNARYLTPETEAVRGTPYPLQCVGTEPFWSLHLDPPVARFVMPEGSADWRLEETEVGTAARTGTLRGPTGVGRVDARRAQPLCSDGMSDVGFPFDVEVLTPNGRELTGCCSRAAANTGSIPK